MKFLHTADWHLGRTVRGRSRDDEHHAALRQLLAHATEQRVDCLLVAGDLFDTATPSPESERLAYQFFCELHGAGIPAVVIAGNHDHPRRLEAVAPVLRALRIHARGQPAGPGQGGVFEVESRDGAERAVVAALPWINERDAVDFAELEREQSAPIVQYAERVKQAMDYLAAAFRPDAPSVLLCHLLVSDAEVGPGGGERPLSIDMGIYGVRAGMLPKEAQYTALGHVHKPQAVRSSPPAWYPGSLLQLDFGEQRQDKFANLVEIQPRQPARVTQLPITAGRPLLDVGSPARGVRLDELESRAPEVGDSWLRVYVDVDRPVANLVSLVRDALPNAVHIQSLRPDPGPPPPPPDGKNPVELFSAFYRSPVGRGREPSGPTRELFRELLEEEVRAAAEA